MKSWDEFRREIRRRKAKRWVATLAAEPTGRAAGRRPRDPLQEALLAELDRARIERSELLRSARRIPVEGDE